MGFDKVVVHLIFFAVFIAGGGALGLAILDAHERLREADAEARERRDELLYTSIDGFVATYAPATDTLTFDLENDGRSGLDPRAVTVVVDGVLVTGWTVTVDGIASDLWFPGETATYVVTGLTTPPGRLVVTTAHGHTFRTAMDFSVIDTIVVTPSSATVAVGATQDFDAVAYDADGAVLPDVVFTWTTTAGTVASVDDDTGRLTGGGAPGSYTVTASAGGKSGVATVTLVVGALDHVHASPATARIASRGEQTFTATAHDASHNVRAGHTFAWSSTVGSVDAAGLFRAPAADASGTVTATTDGVPGSATVTVVRHSYVSTTLVDVAGGTVASVDAMAREGGGDVATLDEARSSTAELKPSVQNERDFETAPLTGWTVSPVTGTFSLAQVDTDGTPTATGAMLLTKTNTGTGSARVHWSWSQSAPATTDATFSASYKFSGATNVDRWLEVYLVKPDASTVQIGTRKASTAGAWAAFGATTVASSHLTQTGSYTLRLLVGLRGTSDTFRADNVDLAWTSQGPFRFGRELSVPNLPTAGGAVDHTLEVRYRVVSVDEGLDLSTEGPPATWTDRTTLSSTSFATFTRLLTPDEILTDRASLRLVDDLRVTDDTSERWEVDYVRVLSEVPLVIDHVHVTPDPTTVAVGATRAFTAVAHDASHAVLTGAVFSWTTDAGSIASTGDTTATLTAQTTPATGRIATATASGRSGSATVDVVVGALDHAHVTPSTFTVASSGRQQLTATGHDAYHNVIAGTTFTWSATIGAVDAAGLFTAPAADATGTVTATAGAVSDAASVTSVRHRYASQTVANVAGGTIANAPAFSQDGGGDVATFAEEAPSTAERKPSVQNERDFENSPLTGWTVTPVTGSFGLTQFDTDGTPTTTGSMQLRKSNNGGGSARVEWSWTQAAADSATDATFNMNYKFTGGASAARYADVFLVKPDASTVQIGVRKTSTSGAWAAFGATTVSGAHLTAAGTYTIRLVVGLTGNGDVFRADNVDMTWTSTAPQRFGKEFTVPSLPTVGGTITYTLEVRYRVAAGTEGLDVLTEGPAGTWTSRGSLDQPAFVTFTRTLTAAEVQTDLVRLRLVDLTTSGDAAQGQWEIDYIRVESVGT